MNIVFKSIATLFYSLVLLASFTQVTIISNAFYYVFLGLSLLFGIVCLVVSKQYISKRLLLFFGFFLLPSLIAIIGLFAGAFYESDLFDYEKLNPLGRVANLI